MRTIATLAAAASFSAGHTALAQLDEGDIRVSIEGGRLAVSLITEDGEDAPQRVFLAEIGIVEFEEGDGSPGDGGPDVFQEILPEETPFSTNTPGFDSGPGVFPPGALVGFDLARDFRFYNADADGFFTTDVTGDVGGDVVEALQIEFNEVAFLTNDIGLPFPPVADAFPFGGLPTFSNGRFHRHFNFVLLPLDMSDPSNPFSLADPAVYVLTLELTTDAQGVERSEPFSILFGFGVSEESPEFAAAGVRAIRELTPADFNGDGSVTFGDVTAFIAAFNGGAGALSADLNGDGMVTFGDVTLFIDEFNAGL